MKEGLELRTPSKKEMREIIERMPVSIAEHGELVRRLDEEEDPEKLYGDLVRESLEKGSSAFCCWWVCDGGTGGQCNCRCEMMDNHCGCGNIKVPGICMAGQQG